MEAIALRLEAIATSNKKLLMKEREKRTNVKAARSAHVKTKRSFLLGRCLSCRDSRGPCVGAGFEVKQRRHAKSCKLKFKMNMSTWFCGTKSTPVVVGNQCSKQGRRNVDAPPLKGLLAAVSAAIPLLHLRVVC